MSRCEPCAGSGEEYTTNAEGGLDRVPCLFCKGSGQRAPKPMTGPTLAEMVAVLRSPEAPRLDVLVVAQVVEEIDRRLTVLEVCSALRSALDPKGLSVGAAADALRIEAYLDSCTAQITAGEIARVLDLPADRVREVIRRAGITHRWLV